MIASDAMDRCMGTGSIVIIILVHSIDDLNSKPKHHTHHTHTSVPDALGATINQLTLLFICPELISKLQMFGLVDSAS